MTRTAPFDLQTEASRDLARRAQRLADGVTRAADRDHLLRYAEDLEKQADRLERRPSEAEPAFALSFSSV